MFFIERKLEDKERKKLPGNFISLPLGLVHYELAGKEQAPLVVFVSGISVPYATWDNNFYSLVEAGFRCLRFDFYGRGYSDRPKVPYDLDLFVQQLENLIMSLRLDSKKVNLIALSMGGVVAASFTHRNPEKVQSLTLVDCLFEHFQFTQKQKQFLNSLRGKIIKRILGKYLLCRNQKNDFNISKQHDLFMPAYRLQMEFSGFVNAVYATFESLPDWKIKDQYKELSKMELPLQIIWGSCDATFPLESTIRLRNVLKSAQFYVIENAGHVPHYEESGKFNGLLLRFLKTV